MTLELTIQACQKCGYRESKTIQTEPQLYDKGDSPLLSAKWQGFNIY